MPFFKHGQSSEPAPYDSCDRPTNTKTLISAPIPIELRDEEALSNSTLKSLRESTMMLAQAKRQGTMWDDRDT